MDICIDIIASLFQSFLNSVNSVPSVNNEKSIHSVNNVSSVVWLYGAMQPPSLIFIVFSGKDIFSTNAIFHPVIIFLITFQDVFLFYICVETDRCPVHCQCTFMGPKILDNHKCINRCFMCAKLYLSTNFCNLVLPSLLLQ